MKPLKVLFTVCTLLCAFNIQSLVAEESAVDPFLRQMDEEKLAYQVYTKLAESYPNIRPFQNIPKAERRHYEALRQHALKVQNAVDPGPVDSAFIYDETGDLFEQLIGKGLESKAAAIQVGIDIETLDIRDLKEAIKASDDPVLTGIYKRLLDGSQRHLKAFERNQMR